MSSLSTRGPGKSISNSKSNVAISTRPLSCLKLHSYSLKMNNSPKCISPMDRSARFHLLR